jgi:hypothetical protein
MVRHSERMQSFLDRSLSSAWYVGPILSVAFLAVHSFDIASYPLFGYDEVLLNDAGHKLATTGQFRADVLSHTPGFERKGFGTPQIAQIVQIGLDCPTEICDARQRPGQSERLPRTPFVNDCVRPPSTPGHRQILLYENRTRDSHRPT